MPEERGLYFYGLTSMKNHAQSKVRGVSPKRDMASLDPAPTETARGDFDANRGRPRGSPKIVSLLLKESST
jgi:hypothetical protein